jgi:Family of unknown function (DUF5985)
MRTYIWGVLTMACVVVAIFFFHYWRSSRERLFAYFSVAFATMAVDWLVHALVVPADPVRAEAYLMHQPEIYLVRLAAFVVILIAIIDKNRQGRRR